jgi:DNA polymerase-3 subunit delta'
VTLSSTPHSTAPGTVLDDPPPVWRDLVGQERVVAVLAAAVRDAQQMLTDRSLPTEADEPASRSGAAMTHAWLFTGPPGSGRSTAARAFAAALQCPDGGCGACDACRTALAGTHADVDVVRAHGISIRVDDARDMVARSARFPAGGRWQVMIVEDADRLQERAANALLKAIEEPTLRTVWLLCAPSLEDMPPTVRSRCRHVALRTPPSAAVAAVLVHRDGVDPAMATFAARAAQGHIGRAKRLARDEEARMRRHAVLRLPQALGSLSSALAAAADLVDAASAEASDATGELDAAETEYTRRSLGVAAGTRQPPGAAAALKELEREQKRRATRARRDSIDRALVDLASFYRDVLAVQADAEVELVNDEMRDAVVSVARTSSPTSTLRRIDAVLAARAAIDLSVAPLLAVEAMTVSLRDG